jgi:hypothetical protein
MIEYATIFIAGFVSVFAQGFQSRNVNHGNYIGAAVTSMFVGITSAHLWELITSPEMGATAGVVYGLSGAFGITSSMYVHQRFMNNDRGPTNRRR